MGTAEDYGLPEAEDLETVGYVVVRACVRGLRIVRIEILRIRSGVLIHCLCPGVLSFDLEVVRKVVAQGGNQPVVIAAAGVGIVVDEISKRTESLTVIRRDQVIVRLHVQMPRLAALVAKRSNQVVRQ